ncbi:MAG TPA: hypothetical protein VNW47_12715 [Terriglobales bacterium]|jgi:hypothetical protein|nr:hypothetical protein [Terriglobales bacterium]
MFTTRRPSYWLLVAPALCILWSQRAYTLAPQDSSATPVASKPSGQDQPSADSVTKQAAPDLKPASAEEGKLATVNDAKIPSYSKVYVAPMVGGFDNYVVAGLRNKKVPLTVVVDRSKADYEISGVSDSEKAGWAKMLFLGSQNSNEEASIKVANLKTGAVIFGYSVHKTNSVRGRQSAGEACAKHIKQIVLE